MKRCLIAIAIVVATQAACVAIYAPPLHAGVGRDFALPRAVLCDVRGVC